MTAERENQLSPGMNPKLSTLKTYMGNLKRTGGKGAVSNKEKVPMNLGGGRRWREGNDINTTLPYKIIKSINKF